MRRRKKKDYLEFIENIFTLNYNKKMVALLDPSMNLADKYLVVILVHY
jgi:hypothetical protein